MIITFRVSQNTMATCRGRGCSPVGGMSGSGGGCGGGGERDGRTTAVVGIFTGVINRR
jgi:hypothetical protein